MLRYGAWASYCGGFACCRAWDLGVWASVYLQHASSKATELGLSSCDALA